MNWISRKVHLYNVTMGLYMLDWWERFLFNALILVLLWFICYNGSRFAAEFYDRLRSLSTFDLICSHVKTKMLVGGHDFAVGGSVAS